MNVKTFDPNKIKELLKNADPYIKVYIEKLQQSSDIWKDLFNEALLKLKAKESDISKSYVVKSKEYQDLQQEYEDYIQSCADVINQKDEELKKCYYDLAEAYKELI